MSTPKASGRLAATGSSAPAGCEASGAPRRVAGVASSAPMLARLRAMPARRRVFLGYAFLVLGAIGLSLRWVVDQAIRAPISARSAWS